MRGLRGMKTKENEEKSISAWHAAFAKCVSERGEVARRV